MGRLTRSDLVEAEVLWLLSITWGGQVYCFSTRPISPVDEDGTSLPHHGGLGSLEYEDSLEILTTSPELRTVAVEVAFGIDVAERIEAGHDLASAEGELALWVVGTPYEVRQVLLVGQVVEPEYGSESEPVTFSLEENPFDDTALIPPSTARVTESTWEQGISAYQTPDQSWGLYYPIVFGQPGVYTDDGGSTSIGRGSPTVVVDYANLSGEAQVLVIAGHAVEASTVVIVDQEGAFVTRSVITTTDELGRTISTVDVHLLTSIDRTGDLCASAAQYPATRRR